MILLRPSGYRAVWVMACGVLRETSRGRVAL